jgi:hypothetical protein
MPLRLDNETPRCEGKPLKEGVYRLKLGIGSRVVSDYTEIIKVLPKVSIEGNYTIWGLKSTQILTMFGEFQTLQLTNFSVQLDGITLGILSKNQNRLKIEINSLDYEIGLRHL